MGRSKKGKYAAIKAQAVAEMAAGATGPAMAEKYGVDVKTIYRWYHAAEQAKDLPTLKRGQGHGRPVRCVETGVVYSSCAEAARAHYISDTAIKCAARKDPTAAGYHWAFVDEGVQA